MGYEYDDDGTGQRDPAGRLEPSSRQRLLRQISFGNRCVGGRGDGCNKPEDDEGDNRHRRCLGVDDRDQAAETAAYLQRAHRHGCRSRRDRQSGKSRSVAWFAFQTAVSGDCERQHEPQQPSWTRPTGRYPESEEHEVIEKVRGVTGGAEKDPGGNHKCEDRNQIGNPKQQPGRDRKSSGEARTTRVIRVKFAGQCPDTNRCHPGSPGEVECRPESVTDRHDEQDEPRQTGEDQGVEIRPVARVDGTGETRNYQTTNPGSW